MIAAAAVLAFALSPARAQDNPVLGFGQKKPYGILILAYDVDTDWRKELGSLRSRLKGFAVESAEVSNINGDVDAFPIQHALDRLQNQRVDKIVAIPLETIEESPRLEQTRYLFGVRADPVDESPDSESKPLPALKPVTKSLLKLPRENPRQKRLTSRTALVLAPTLERSPLLTAILADRAKALAHNPAQEAVVLAGVAPRSDEAMAAWKTAAAAIAEEVRVKGGFRKAAVAALRDGVRQEQQDKDQQELRKTFRALATEGPITVVSLSPAASRVQQLLTKRPPGPAYRWNKDRAGILGDSRLYEWLKTSAEAAARLPDSRQYRDGGYGSLRGLP